MAPQGITRRKGTTDDGKPYEQKVAALLGVKCALEDDVEEMWMATNIEGLGAFDDLVLFVQKKSGNYSTKKMYLIQIKHKKNKPINLSSSDNDLIKYQKSFLKIKEDFLNSTSPLQDDCKFEDIQFILFTNIKIVASNTVTFSEYKNCSDFINTGKIFQISHDTNNSYDPDFLNQILFYSNQVIKNETNKYFMNCHVEAITKFFENWHSEHFSNKIKLNREDIQSVILETMLSKYIPEPILTDFPKADIWNEVASQFQFTFLRKDDHLAKIWQAIKILMCDIFDDQTIDLVKWYENLKGASDKINKLNQCVHNVQFPIKKDKASYTIKDLYLLLWHMCKLPLILNLNNVGIDSEKDIHVALSKLDSSKGNRRRYLFIGEVTSNLVQYQTHFNVLHINRDIKEKVLKNACVSLQGKEAVTLKELNLNDVALEKISPELLIELLQPIKRKVKDDVAYIPRFIRQPVVVADVLHIPDVVFVIAVSDNTPLNYKMLEGSISWQMYKLFANKFVNMINDEHFSPSAIKYIIFNKNVITLKEYKYIEETINKVRKCEDQTIHYFRILNESQLEWLNSNKNAYQIKPFLISNSEHYLSDSKLHHYLTFNILSGNTGEGKSTLLHYLEDNSPTNVWVTKLNMREVAEYIEKGEFSDIKMDLYHQYMESSKCFKEFWWELFQGLYEDRNILIIIDGLDEVEYNSNTKHFLDTVKSLGIKTILATRPSLKSYLEEKDNMPLLFLKPFTRENCELLLRPALREDIHIDVILKKIFTWNNTVGIPLLLKLFTSLFNEENLLDFRKFDITDLFEKYIREQLRKVDSDNRFTMRTLSRVALFTLYTEEAISKLFRIEEYLEEVEDKIRIFVESKLIDKPNKNKNPIFAHKSIAEFLVAKLFYKLAEEQKSDITDFLKSLFYQELETVRLFFDIIALKGSELQDIITGNNTNDLYNKINKDMVDKFGRHALHIAASYGSKCELRTLTSLWSGVKIHELYNVMFKNDLIQPYKDFERRTVVPLNYVHNLLQKDLDPFKKDKLFEMDVFEFAIESGSLKVVEVLFGKKNIKQLENVNSDVLLFSIVKEGCINLFRQLEIKNFNLKVLPSLNNLLHIALTNENFEIIKELTEVIPIEEANRFGHSPLINWLCSSKLSNSNEYLLSMTMNRNLSFNDNQLQILNHFIDKKVDLNACNILGETPLHAFCNAQPSIFELLPKNGADVNKKTKMGALPLHYAAQYSLENVKLLIKYNSAVDIYDTQGNTPLCCAVRNNKIDIAKYLIKKGSYINPSNRYRKQPLNVAIEWGNVDCVKLLIEEHVKINNNHVLTAVYFGNLECIKLLLKNSTNVSEQVFLLAVLLNQKGILKFLQSEKLYINTCVNMNELLFYAIEIDDIDLIDILISYGADVNAKDGKTGNNLLHEACLFGSQKVVENFINHKSLVNMKNNEGSIALLNAVESGNLEIVKIMVKSRSDLQEYGPDVLYNAARNDHNDIIDYLISAGAEINAITSRTGAAIHLASKTNLNCVKSLTRMGAGVNLKTVNEGFTPLMIAAANGFQDIVEYLIDNGAKVNEEDMEKRIALTFAAAEGHLECVQFLINKDSDLCNHGSRAIYFTSTRSHTDIVDCLISAGADINKLIENKSAPIHVAVFESNLKVVKYLLSKGADINLKNSQSLTPLMVAALTGSQEIMRYLIEQGAKLNEEDANQHTALVMAAQEGHLECLELLVDKVSDLCKYGPLAIYFAAIGEHTAAVDYLISKGADINKLIENQDAPIHMAVLENNLQLVKYLLSKGADINLKNSQSLTPLMLAAFIGSQEIIRCLIKQGAKLNDENDNQQTALAMAAQEGHLECLEILVDKVSDLCKYGPFAIYFAAIGEHTPAVDYLISKGADINKLIENQAAPIHVAVLVNNLQLVKYLLSKGADINLKTSENLTPLMLAASEGSQEIMRFLIEQGSKLNEEDANQNTALVMAAQEGHLECLKILVDNDSNLCKYGPLAIYFAAIGEHTAAVDYLISKGADINKLMENKTAPIHDAVLANNLKLVQYLLSKGADINLKISQSLTPLMVAALTGSQEIMPYLIEQGAQLNDENVNQHTALLMAAQKGHMECLKILVDKGSDLCKYGPLAIYFAAIGEHTAAVDYLISKGANINGITFVNTPLHNAVMNNNLKALKYLLNKESDINVKNDDGITPLIMAAQKGHMECLKILVDKGSDLCKYGPLAIYFAAIGEHTAAVDYLISKGANINGITFVNTPLHNAVMNNNLKALKYLLNKESDINVKNDNGITPLIMAASKGFKDIVAHLIDSGATLDIERETGETALIMASQEGHLDCVKLLLREGSDVRKYGPLAKDAATRNSHTDIANYLILYLSN